MKTRQFSFADMKQTFEFGGELLKKAKNRRARPVSSKEPMHIVLRSTQAVGRRSFGHSRNVVAISDCLKRHCRKYGVKLVKWSNNFNHLHLLLKFPSKGIYLRFIRSLSTHIAMIASGAKKGLRLARRFWDFRPFSRIVRGRRAFIIVCDYIRLNQLEAAGLSPLRSKVPG